MFTGLITDVGEVVAVEQTAAPQEGASCERAPDRAPLRVRIACRYDMQNVQLGDSIACDGVCLSVVEISERGFSVDISAETLRCSTLGGWQPGTQVNLEQALRLGDALGGHLVSGHVDAVTTLRAVAVRDGHTQWQVAIPDGYAPYIAAKGSVVLQGVSLTVNEVDAGNRWFSVNLIPHTAAHTTLGKKSVAEALNLEIDLVARYIARMLQMQQADTAPDRALPPTQEQENV